MQRRRQHLTPNKQILPCSKRNPIVIITDTDFADDVALISDTIEKPQLLLLKVKTAAVPVGLHLNVTKTEYIMHNQDKNYIITLIYWRTPEMC